MFYSSLIDISEKGNFINALCYSTIEVDKNSILIVRKHRPKVNIFGCSSFQGVFTPKGFLRGAHFLCFSESDNIDIYPVIYQATPEDAKNKTIEYCKRIRENFTIPDVILMHAVPGFEEKVIEGINEVFGSSVRVFGGSAADDDITGKWFVFLNDTFLNDGVLLVGIRNNSGKIYGSFLSGYLPTDKKGKITKAQGRVIYEIDGKPAAEVYNEWTGGLISEYLEKGGVVLGPTTLKPIGRIIGEVMGIKQYLLSHPHMVIKENKALSLFTEFSEGDEIILMSGYKSALIDRTRQVYERAMGIDLRKVKPKGAVLVYCGGCVGAIIDSIEQVNTSYISSLGIGVPFIGAATFGEQGCFIIGNTRQNKHGNLMTDNIIFA